MRDLTKKFKSRPLLSESHEALERKIVSLLKQNLKPEEIFNKIKSSPNVEGVGRFLYNFGLHKTLFQFSVYKLKKGDSLPWPYLLKLFTKYKITPNEYLEKLIFHHWLKKTENQTPALFACRDWAGLSSEFQQMMFVYLKGLEDKNNSEESDLQEQLEFVKSQGLIKEEEEILEKLLIINPKSRRYKKWRDDLEEKKAMLTIEEQKRIFEKEKFLDDYASDFSVGGLALKEKWFKAAAAQVEARPKDAKNLAVFLYFCGWPDKALEILERYISSLSDYWFYLDWILETKQYTKGLELINHLLAEQSEDSELFFLPLIYLKSQMLYALGKKNEAVEYLTAVCQVQPEYKSAQYLLDKWMKKI